MRVNLAAIAVLSVLCLQAPARADEVPEHPVVKHYPGATIEEGQFHDFDAIEVVTGYTAGPEPSVSVESIEGRIWKFQYDNDPKSGVLKIVRNYENALKQIGFTTIVVTKGDKVDIPSVGQGDVFGAFRLEKDGVPKIYVNVKAVTDTTYVWSHVLIVEPTAMEQEYVAGAGELYDGLKKSGRIAVYGITFDTGKALLQPASEKVLEEVRKLLDEHADLKLRIEGHTDNVGSAASNQTLSMARAAAVKTWLVEQGIEDGRLNSAGFGDTKPVAPNDSEDGRAKNRRVELVKVE